ncbi:MAG TPA: methionyl-tRNA formyltransferase [Acidimicrobiales bacterium]|nr:methionyl-tRNA formyltransferase [Acidimicrobiales bacterium]
MAVPPLRALVEEGHRVVMVVTQPDRKRGRGGALLPSPVKAAATDLGLPVTERVDDLLGAGAELGVVVAYGRLIRPHVLAALPMVNLHFSLLPRWRGAAPVERAILAGDTTTGVCLMALEEGLDTGPVYDCRQVEIGDEETADELRARLVGLGTDLLVNALRDGLPEPTPQHGEATYAAKLDPSEHHLDWSRPATELARVVRLGQAWTTFRGKRLKVRRARPVTGEGGPPAAGPDGGPGVLDPDSLRVATGEGAVELVEVQPEGRGPQAAADWRNGARPLPGERLGG